MKPHSSSRRSRAFTLIEMLIVVSVIGMLLALTAPRVFSILRSNELSTQGETLRNWLSQAQQKALSSNADVEVRFYKFADLNSSQVEPEYRGAVYYQHDRFGELQPNSQIFRIRNPLSLSDNPRLSNILDQRMNKSPANSSEIQKEIRELFGLSVDTSSVEYSSFRFRPNGSTDLDKTEVWFMTLVEDGRNVSGPGGSEIPRNFVCLQIDPFNGTIREYRP